MGKIKIFFYKIILIICILLFIYLSKLLLWSSKLKKILFYICCNSAIILSIYSIIYPSFAINMNLSFIIKHYKFNRLTYKLFSYILILIRLIIIFTRIIILFNFIKFENYHKNCPFNINFDSIRINKSSYESRICELYNINKNSKYKYQYICSYNATDDFENDNTEDGLDEIICIQKINNIENNDIIDKFNELFDNKDKNETKLFYCSRIDKPAKDEYIKDEYCNIKDINFTLANLFLTILDLFMIFEDILFNEIRQTITNRIRYLIEIIIHYDQLSMAEEDLATEYDESNSNNISFDEEEDKNIIIENNEVYNVDFNIKNFVEEGKLI